MGTSTVLAHERNSQQLGGEDLEPTVDRVLDQVTDLLNATKGSTSSPISTSHTLLPSMGTSHESVERSDDKLNMASKAQASAMSSVTPRVLRAMFPDKSSSNSKAPPRRVDTGWTYSSARCGREHLINDPPCDCGVGPSTVAFLAPKSGAGQASETDSNEDIASMIPKTLIPDDYKVVISGPTRPLEVSDELYATSAGAHAAHAVVFPSLRPTKRAEVHHLKTTLELMIKKLDDRAQVKEEDLRHRIENGLLDEDEAIALDMHSFLSVMQEEQTIYNIVFHELVRQTTVHCAERGALLADLRVRYAGLFAKMPQYATNMYHKCLAQRAICRRLGQCLASVRDDLEAVASGHDELKAAKDTAETVAEESLSKIARLEAENRRHVETMDEFHDLYRMNRERLVSELRSVAQDRMMWNQTAMALANQVAAQDTLLGDLMQSLSDSAARWGSCGSDVLGAAKGDMSSLMNGLEVEKNNWYSHGQEYVSTLKNRCFRVISAYDDLSRDLRDWNKNMKRAIETRLDEQVDSQGKPLVLERLTDPVLARSDLVRLREVFRGWKSTLSKMLEAYQQGGFMWSLQKDLVPVKAFMHHWMSSATQILSKRPQVMQQTDLAPQLSAVQSTHSEWTNDILKSLIALKMPPQGSSGSGSSANFATGPVLSSTLDSTVLQAALGEGEVAVLELLDISANAAGANDGAKPATAPDDARDEHGLAKLIMAVDLMDAQLQSYFDDCQSGVVDIGDERLRLLVHKVSTMTDAWKATVDAEVSALTRLSEDGERVHSIRNSIVDWMDALQRHLTQAMSVASKERDDLMEGMSEWMVRLTSLMASEDTEDEDHEIRESLIFDASGIPEAPDPSLLDSKNARAFRIYQRVSLARFQARVAAWTDYVQSFSLDRRPELLNRLHELAAGWSNAAKDIQNLPVSKALEPSANAIASGTANLATTSEAIARSKSAISLTAASLMLPMMRNGSSSNLATPDEVESMANGLVTVSRSGSMLWKGANVYKTIGTQVEPGELTSPDDDAMGLNANVPDSSEVTDQQLGGTDIAGNDVRETGSGEPSSGAFGDDDTFKETRVDEGDLGEGVDDMLSRSTEASPSRAESSPRLHKVTAAKRGMSHFVSTVSIKGGDRKISLRASGSRPSSRSSSRAGSRASSRNSSRSRTQQAFFALRSRVEEIENIIAKSGPGESLPSSVLAHMRVAGQLALSLDANGGRGRSALVKRLGGETRSRGVKSRGWLIKLIREIYDAKTISDVEMESQSTDAGLLPMFERLPDFVYDFVSNKYGLKSLVDGHLWDMLNTMDAYRSCDTEVELFAQFLEESRLKDELVFFLKCRAAVEKVPVGTRVPEDASSTMPVYCCLVRAGEVVRLGLELLMPELSLAKVLHIVEAQSISSRELVDANRAYLPKSGGTGHKSDNDSKLSRNRRISLEELCRILMDEYRKAQAAHVEKLGTLFDRMDENKDGLLSYEEFAKAAYVADPMLTQKQVIRLYATATARSESSGLTKAMFDTVSLDLGFHRRRTRARGEPGKRGAGTRAPGDDEGEIDEDARTDAAFGVMRARWEALEPRVNDLISRLSSGKDFRDNAAANVLKDLKSGLARHLDADQEGRATGDVRSAGALMAQLISTIQSHSQVEMKRRGFISEAGALDAALESLTGLMDATLGTGQ